MCSQGSATGHPQGSRTRITPTHAVSLRSILIVSPRLRTWISGDLLCLGSSTEILYVFIMSNMYAKCPAYLIHDFITIVMFSEQQKLRNCILSDVV